MKKQGKVFIHTKDPSKAKLLDYAITLKGYEVCISEEDADVIILDFKLLEGFSYLIGDIPVIVLGHFHDEDEILKGIYKRYHDYVLEPFEISELEMVVDKNLQRKMFNRPTLPLTLDYLT